MGWGTYVAGVTALMGYVAWMLTRGPAQGAVADFWFETVLLALNVAVVGIVGGAVGSAYQAQRALDSFRAEVLEELGSAHKALYVVRRQLVHRGTDAEAFDACVQRIMEVRCDLGNVGHRVRLKRALGPDRIRDHVDTMRAYLEELIDEALVESGMGPKLRAFAWSPSGRTVDYDARFKVPYLRAKLAVDPSYKPSRDQKALLRRHPRRRRLK